MAKGSAVPLPSERFVPSNRQVPAYKSAVSKRGRFRLGRIQGLPQAGNISSRRQPSQGITVSSHPSARSRFAMPANSPAVRP